MKTLVKDLEVKVILAEDGSLTYTVYEPESGSCVDLRGTFDCTVDDELREKVASELCSWAYLMSDEFEDLLAEEDEPEIVSRDYVEQPPRGSRYEVLYCYDDEWAGTVDDRTYFTGTWDELQSYIKQLRAMDCFNIEAVDVTPEADDEDDDVYRGPVINSLDDLLKYTGCADETKLAEHVGYTAECNASITADEKAVTVTGFLSEIDEELSNSFFFPFNAYYFDSWVDELRVELDIAYREHGYC